MTIGDFAKARRMDFKGLLAEAGEDNVGLWELAGIAKVPWMKERQATLWGRSSTS